MCGRWRFRAPFARVQEGAWSRKERRGELCWAGHGDGVCAARDRGTERERGEREMRASARLLHSTKQHAGVVRGDDGAWAPRGREVGCQFGHGRHASSVCHPARRFVEHVAGNRVGKVDADFEPTTG
jgi:hypothetical protein